jgi:hypothetical protein
MEKNKKKKKSILPDEGEDQLADLPNKEAKGWDKLWTRFKEDLGNKKEGK